MNEREKILFFWCNDYGNLHENSCAMVLNNHVDVSPTQNVSFRACQLLNHFYEFNAADWAHDPFQTKNNIDNNETFILFPSSSSFVYISI